MQIDRHGQLLERALQVHAIAEIAPAVEATGAAVYLVGGAVRDLLLRRPSHDVDLAIDGDVAELAAAIGGLAGGGTRFGTVSVTRGGQRYDLARTRSEHYPYPGALPEVEPAGIAADLRRRDFTVNAIALGLSGADRGRLLGVPHTLEDLEARQLAVLQDRSFIDDPTRLLRLARYAARLGFAPAPHTRELAMQATAAGALEAISGTRLGNELRLLAGEPDPIAAFEQVAALGLPWKIIDAGRAREALQILPADGRADLVVLALALGAGGDLDRFGFEAAERKAIAQAATAPALAMRLAGLERPSEIARTVGRSGIETVALAYSQGAPSQSLTWLRDLRHRRLEITGEDLIANGLAQGPQIGRALQAARDALMDGDAVDRAAQLRVALSAAE